MIIQKDILNDLYRIEENTSDFELANIVFLTLDMLSQRYNYSNTEKEINYKKMIDNYKENIIKNYV